jgi:hypothetical protein
MPAPAKSKPGKLPLHCVRCGHEWTTRYDTPPEICPKCKTLKWNEPYPEGERFLQAVEKALQQELPPEMRRWMRTAFDFYRRAPAAVGLAEDILKALGR